MRFNQKLNCFWLTLNRECNLRCEWCYAKGTDYSTSDNMSFFDACKAINLAEEYGIKTVSLIGGEPLYWKNIIELIEYISSKKIKAGLITNGVLLSDKDYLQHIHSAGLNSINISIKADTKKRYIEQTGMDVFQEVYSAIKNVNELKINNQVSFVITEDNIDSLENVFDVVESAGGKAIYLSFCNAFVDDNIFSGLKNPIELIDHFISIYDKINAKNIKIKFHQNLPNCIWPKDFLQEMINRNQIITVCQLHKKAGLVLDPKLRVLLCNALYNYPIGQLGVDFSTAEELGHFFNSSKVNNIYKTILRSPTEKCEICEDFINCAGGCVLQWFQYSYEDLMKMKSENAASRKSL